MVRKLGIALDLIMYVVNWPFMWLAYWVGITANYSTYKKDRFAYALRLYDTEGVEPAADFLERTPRTLREYHRYLQGVNIGR